MEHEADTEENTDPFYTVLIYVAYLMPLVWTPINIEFSSNLLFWFSGCIHLKSETQNNLDGKRFQGSCDPTSCSKQGQLQRQIQILSYIRSLQVLLSCGWIFHNFPGQYFLLFTRIIVGKKKKKKEGKILPIF